MRNYPHLTRQLDIIPVDTLGLRLNVIGAGAVGSFTTLALAKMGFLDITVWDDDEITVENMNCQFYRRGDIGRRKVEALRDLVADFTGVELDVRTTRYPATTDADPLCGVVITAVDSMAARRTIWEAHAGRSFGTTLFIDPRMGAEAALCYAVKPMSESDGATYVRTLYSDERALQEPCTAKATTYTALMLAGYVAKVVKDFVVSGGRHYPRLTMWNVADNALQVTPA